MSSLPSFETMIVRTERGLSISGTRITLYDVMDYVDQYPPEFIQSLLGLNCQQIDVAIAYIESNRDAVEAEYQIVLEQAAEIRQYWEERNRDHFAQVANQSPKPGQEALWAKLNEQKAKRELEEA